MFSQGKCVLLSDTQRGLDAETSLFTTGAETAPVRCTPCLAPSRYTRCASYGILLSEGWFLLASPQPSSLSLPGGPAVLRGSRVSAIQDAGGGPSASPVLRGLMAPGPRPGAGKGGAASQSISSSLWQPRWPGRATQPTSGQSACVPLAGLLFPWGPGDAHRWVNPLG